MTLLLYLYWSLFEKLVVAQYHPWESFNLNGIMVDENNIVSIISPLRVHSWSLIDKMPGSESHPKKYVILNVILVGRPICFYVYSTYSSHLEPD